MIPLGPVVARARVEAPRTAVWEFLINPEHRNTWWPGVQLDAEVGGAVSERATGAVEGAGVAASASANAAASAGADADADADAAGSETELSVGTTAPPAHEADGVVDVLVKGHAIGFAWHEPGERDTSVLLTLRSHGSETGVTLTESGFDAVDAPAERAAAASARWEQILGALPAQLEQAIADGFEVETASVVVADTAVDEHADEVGDGNAGDAESGDAPVSDEVLELEESDSDDDEAVECVEDEGLEGAVIPTDADAEADAEVGASEDEQVVDAEIIEPVDVDAPASSEVAELEEADIDDDEAVADEAAEDEPLEGAVLVEEADPQGDAETAEPAESEIDPADEAEAVEAAEDAAEPEEVDVLEELFGDDEDDEPSETIELTEDAEDDDFDEPIPTGEVPLVLPGPPEETDGEKAETDDDGTGDPDFDSLLRGPSN